MSTCNIRPLANYSLEYTENILVVNALDFTAERKMTGTTKREGHEINFFNINV
jgi:hypothetical protein